MRKNIGNSIWILKSQIYNLCPWLMCESLFLILPFWIGLICYEVDWVHLETCPQIHTFIPTISRLSEIFQRSVKAEEIAADFTTYFCQIAKPKGWYTSHLGLSIITFLKGRGGLLSCLRKCGRSASCSLWFLQNSYFLVQVSCSAVWEVCCTVICQGHR